MNSDQFKTDFYKVLGVSENATHDEIKKAYRKLALKWHPDKHVENKKDAEEKFKVINEAYAILSDKSNKQEYDDYRKYGESRGKKFDFKSHFDMEREDPFEMFEKFFNRDFKNFGFEDDDEDDFFNFSNFGNFGRFKSNMGTKMDNKFPSSSGSSSGVSKSVQKTTQIINGKRITKTVTTTIDKNGEKKVEVIEETDDGKGNKSTKKQISTGGDNFGNFDGFDSDDDFGFGLGSKKKQINKKQLR